MARKRKSFGENTNIILFNQVNGICPLCDIPLVYKKNGYKYKKYELAHIYPLNPTQPESKLLSNEEKLSDDVDDENNLIPLCKICHGKFDKPRTVEEYRNLVGIKKNLISESEQHNLWSQYQIESDIEQIIDALNDIRGTSNSDDIEYDTKTIDSKADSTLSNITKRRIKNNVSDYYSFIRRKLKLVDSVNSGAADIIAIQIKHYYLKQKQSKSSQQEIYTNMVNWILAKTSSQSNDAADIIASFYVQNCELFE